LPDGLEGLLSHNQITFKSHREALDAWAMKELVGNYVAYRKLVSRAPSDLLAEDQFGLARAPILKANLLDGLPPAAAGRRYPVSSRSRRTRAESPPPR
jgi:hypothetical protein